jgi:hypothetical protein
MHGGTVKVYSEGADLGSEFVVRLPLAPGGKAHLAGVQAQLHETCAESAEPMLHRHDSFAGIHAPTPAGPREQRGSSS